MRWIKRLALGLLAAAALPAPYAMSATADLIPVDPLVKVFRGETKLPSASPEADVAVGEHATIQIVFRSAKSVTNLRATVSGDVPGAVVRLVGYVKVGRPYDAPRPTPCLLPTVNSPIPCWKTRALPWRRIRTSRSGSQCLRASPAFSREC